MSSSGVGQREVAYRLFASEFEDAEFSYSESDEDRAPNYVVTPTGARVNRLFVVGVLTEVEQVSDDVLRARVVDLTGAFVLYAGQYQPDEQAFLESVDAPTFVAVTGKARTFQPEDSDQVFTSIRPESINEVDAATRDRWAVQAATQTLSRIGWMARALASDSSGEELQQALRDEGADEALAHGIALALEHYTTTPTYLDALREMALDTARVVAGTRDEVEGLDLSPDASGDVTALDLLERVAVDETVTLEPAADEPAGEVADTEAQPTDTEPATETVPDKAVETEPAPAEETPVESDVEPTTPDTEATAADVEAEVPSDEEETVAAGALSDEEPEDDIGDFDPQEFELEEETRQEIEQEYGTDFQTGTEVDEPGEAGIEPEGEPVAESEETVASEEPVEPEASPEPRSGAPESTPEPETVPGSDAVSDPEETTAPSDSTVESEPEDDTAPAETEPVEQPEDIQEAVVELMRELDDGDGADRDELLVEMGQRYGIDADEVEEAIQNALMDGQCYEPDDTSLKPI